MRVPSGAKKSMFLQYVQNVAVSENKLQRFTTLTRTFLWKYASYTNLGISEMKQKTYETKFMGAIASRSRNFEITSSKKYFHRA
jgi:hypothetical protein